MPIASPADALPTVLRAGLTSGCLLFAGFAIAAAQDASTVPVPPVVDTAALPPLAAAWPAENPYRGNPLAAAVGRSAFNQSCAGCHGQDADGARAPAPDLRRLGRSCQRVQNLALKQRCIEDVDHHFRTSVLRGKVKVGVRHMPAWEPVLPPEVVWAIRTFIETSAVRPQ